MEGAKKICRLLAFFLTPPLNGKIKLSTMDIKKYLGYWAECYREDLVQNIMPFWMKYGLDTENGGVYTCVDRNGELMDTTKSVWFQGRFAP